MLSYQHAYHAGNPADVHKHFALAEVLRLLTVKDRGVSYLETHAGRGLYDLSSEEAQKTGEAAEGITLVPSTDDIAFFKALAAVRAEYGDTAYPGSPMVAAKLLRPQDRMVFIERHPQEHAALRRAMKRSGAEIHHRDAFEGARAVVPLNPRRGLVLIDPPYEVKTDYADTGKLAADLRRRWPEAAVMVWYPILRAGRHTELLAATEEPDRIVHEVTFDLKGGQGMTGSGLLLLGAPYGTDAALEKVMAASASILRALS
ncbi:MAG: 23S rRNA (adenine(2030)-N(6))-methyltransferase RlmJ [Parvularculaceae bacterium]|nr:23S rRNA (adenine(2030)-N(6))-methyltransferase RlmJ [Parvularculaceae bacterium]